MTTLGTDVGRGDFELLRHGDNPIGTWWYEHDGTRYVPKDISAWEADLVLETEFGEPLVTLPCTCSSDGLAMCIIPASVMEGDDLADYTKGVWRITGKLGTQTEVIGTGYFAIT